MCCSQDTETATKVVVQSPVGGVTVTCPDYMATFEDGECSVDVYRGTSINVTISYNDGTQHDLNVPVAGKWTQISKYSELSVTISITSTTL